MRLAGTAMQYSISAMPQLMKIIITSGVLVNFRCPYQAKVMKTLEPMRSRIGRTLGEISADMEATLGTGGWRCWRPGPQPLHTLIEQRQDFANSVIGPSHQSASAPFASEPES